MNHVYELAIEISYVSKRVFCLTLQLNQSQFEIAIDMNTNIIGQVLNQTKICVWSGENKIQFLITNIANYYLFL